MRGQVQKPIGVTRRRRYLVQILCVGDGPSESCGYAVRIRPWSARSNFRSETMERIFADEWEMMEVINPLLLPHGSDVRDVMEEIDGPDGFFYLLRLSSEEAARLGWGVGDREGGAK